ncbi:MAG: SIMPL domain-containing protein [Pseudomonadota bacterium]|nr:SIMPL domain-containing protein [Pseudomonadota bacterium]MEA3241426.1 SIMPL domain-containing protein [Pseudomonadota bacterium]
MKRPSRFWIATCLTLCIACITATSAAGGEAELIPQLTVRGNSTLQVPANQLQMQVGVTTEAKTVKQALDENTKKIQAIEQTLKEIGLSRKEYKTGRFQVQPRWSARPPKYHDAWQAEIIGYRVNNHFSIKTRQIELGGKIIESCTRVGANTIGSIIFNLATPQMYRSQAITAATANARADANALASAAELNLGEVLNISLDNATSTPLRSRSMAYAEGMAKSAAPSLNLSPGKVTVRANVTITYEISGSHKK